MYPAKKSATRESPAAQPAPSARPRRTAQPRRAAPPQPAPPRRRRANRLTRATRPSRDDGLSRPRIVAAAIELLDSAGEGGLTFRALASRLATGAGALYWHIDGKDELLATASHELIAAALADVSAHAAPRRAIRAIATGVLEAIDDHPWLGAVLSHGPWQGATLEIFERVGRQLQAMKIAEGAQVTAAFTLVSYLLGVSHQSAAAGRRVEAGADRAVAVAAEAARWRALDAEAYPFARKIAGRLAKRDDRAELLAGIDLILDGIEAS